MVWVFFLSLCCYKVICMTTFLKPITGLKVKQQITTKINAKQRENLIKQVFNRTLLPELGHMFDHFCGWGTSSPRRWGDEEAYRNKVHGEPLHCPDENRTIWTRDDEENSNVLWTWSHVAQVCLVYLSKPRGKMHLSHFWPHLKDFQRSVTISFLLSPNLHFL